MGRLLLNLKTKDYNSLISPQRLVVVFQPHRFSRTKDFLNDFSKALQKADEVILAPIYGAGEDPINGINSELLANNILIQNPLLPVTAAKDSCELIKLINKQTKQNDLIIIMGAGDINCLWEKLTLKNENYNNFKKKVA